jgi:hypothetical protein
MRESLVVILREQLDSDVVVRESLRSKLQRAFRDYDELRRDFEVVQQRIADVRDELGLEPEEPERVTPPELDDSLERTRAALWVAAQRIAGPGREVDAMDVYDELIVEGGAA